MSKSYTVICECGTPLEILWDEDYYGVEQITVKPHDCCLEPKKCSDAEMEMLGWLHEQGVELEDEDVYDG